MPWYILCVYMRSTFVMHVVVQYVIYIVRTNILGSLGLTKCLRN